MPEPAMHQTYASQYRALWESHWWWRARRRFVLKEIRRVLGGAQGLDILDIGCGDGLFFKDLATLGEPRGIEPDAGLIDPNNPDRDRIEVVPFTPEYQPGQTFDLIVMLDVLEHIEDDTTALNHVFDLLSPGGRVIITVPALDVLWSQHDVANRHYRRYTRRLLSQRMVDAGLAIDRIGYFFGWTVAPMIGRRLLAPAARSEEQATDYKIGIPPKPVNLICQGLCVAEQIVGRAIPLPVGSSVYASAHKPRG